MARATSKFNPIIRPFSIIYYIILLTTEKCVNFLNKMAFEIDLDSITAPTPDKRHARRKEMTYDPMRRKLWEEDVEWFWLWFYDIDNMYLKNSVYEGFTRRYIWVVDYMIS